MVVVDSCIVVILLCAEPRRKHGNATSMLISALVQDGPCRIRKGHLGGDKTLAILHKPELGTHTGWHVEFCCPENMLEPSICRMHHVLAMSRLWLGVLHIFPHNCSCLMASRGGSASR